MPVDVVVAGAGPTGLMLAAELRLAGVDPVVLERLTGISEIPKGNGLIGQIVPVLAYRGLLDRFSAGSTWCGPIPQFSFGGLQVDFSPLGTSPLHVLAIPQRRLEQFLHERVEELGGRVRAGHELLDFSPDGKGLTLWIRGPEGEYQINTRYLVGCDGAHSLIRKRSGIEFPGVTSADLARLGRVSLPSATVIPETGEVELPGAGRLPIVRQVRTPRGSYSLAPLTTLDASATPGMFIVYTSEEGTGEAPTDPDAGMTIQELHDSLARVLGADVDMKDPQWLSRIVGNSRQASRYRAGPILLAGDAAHVLGIGGGLSVGMLDAVNLGWKLAADLQGWAPDGLLDTYHAERHAAGARSLLSSRAQKVLSGPGPGPEALRALFAELLGFPDALRHIGDRMEGSDVRYPMPAGPGPAHPWLGGLSPDLRLVTPQGPARIAQFLTGGRGLLVDLSVEGDVAASAVGWQPRIQVVTAQCVPRPVGVGALLIRPDGHVAWVGADSVPDPAAGLDVALLAWFGAPR